MPDETVYSAELGPSYGTDPDRSGPNTDNVDVALPTAWTEDPVAWDRTADTGIGDIDVTPDGTRLLVMNLENKSLDVYDVTSIQADPATGAPVLLAQWPTPDPGCSPVVTGTQTFSHQPFAVAAVDGRTAFIGVTCADASQAVVYAVDINDGTATTHFVLDSAYMSSVRGCNWFRPCDAIPTFGQARWEPWTADWQDLADTAITAGWDSDVRIAIRPAPLLADINVRADGSMDLSVIDRTSLAAGSNQASPDITTWNHLWIAVATGDLVHVCTNGVMEGRPGCELVGPEYRVDDWVNAVNGFHDEIQVGGAWAPPFGGELVSTVFDPVNDDGVGDNEWNSGGLHWYGEGEGEELDARIVYQNQAFDGFGKTTGLGDVDGCWQPVAIGNRVWLNRIQAEVDSAFPKAQILVRLLEQGPPFDAPVELRIYGPNLNR
ncbi:hypothetical protein, partial [Okeania sp. SIO1H2]|uniref:hypothetical protein n=1 Tax=Okeania sp. SIO1H2 TaxID=2607775 RepID=UPI00257F3C54